MANSPAFGLCCLPSAALRVFGTASLYKNVLLSSPLLAQRLKFYQRQSLRHDQQTLFIVPEVFSYILCYNQLWKYFFTETKIVCTIREVFTFTVSNIGFVLVAPLKANFGVKQSALRVSLLITRRRKYLMRLHLAFVNYKDLWRQQ